MATKPESTKAGAPAPESKPNPNEPLTLKQAILIAVDQTITKDLNGTRHGWSQKVHCRCIARVAISCGLDPAKAKQFVALLGEFGLGGNASQFRQWLEKPTDKDGPGRLDAVASAAALVADL